MCIAKETGLIGSIQTIAILIYQVNIQCKKAQAHFFFAILLMPFYANQSCFGLRALTLKARSSQATMGRTFGLAFAGQVIMG